MGAPQGGVLGAFLQLLKGRMRLVKRTALLLALLLPAAAGAQMFKCADKAGKITYSSQACKDIGLSSAGEVRDTVTVIPAPPMPPKPKPGAEKPASPAGMAPPAPAADAAKKAEPERRCFQVTKTIKTDKGVVTTTSTRCNDTPEEEAKK
jgi:hypothetical protein